MYINYVDILYYLGIRRMYIFKDDKIIFLLKFKNVTT